jgi:hypothetical protein
MSDIDILSISDEIVLMVGSSRSLVSGIDLLPHTEDDDEARQASDSDSVDDEDEDKVYLPSRYTDTPVDQLTINFERVSTGDSVVPLDENIRNSSSEWGMTLDVDATELGTPLPTQLLDSIRNDNATPSHDASYPTAISFDDGQDVPTYTDDSVPLTDMRAEAMQLLKGPMALSSRSWIDNDERIISGPIEPSIFSVVPPNNDTLSTKRDNGATEPLSSTEIVEYFIYLDDPDIIGTSASANPSQFSSATEPASSSTSNHTDNSERATKPVSSTEIVEYYMYLHDPDIIGTIASANPSQSSSATEPASSTPNHTDNSANSNPSPASSTKSNKTKEKKPKKKPQRRQLSDHPVVPTDRDIFFGRGGYNNTHPGNIRFREEALRIRPIYEELTKEEKYGFSLVLVETMKQENRRFLEKDLDGLWYEVNDKGARKKASQALRERLEKRN